MFKNIPVDVIKSIMDILQQKELFNFMISNKEYNQFKRTYYYPHIIFISGSITNFINSFPNFKNIKISRRSELCDEDFELCGHIQRIRMI